MICPINSLPEASIGWALPAMMIWIARDGDAITATRIAPEGDGFFAAEVPVGRGNLHYPTPETMESPPVDWPVLGGAEVEVGGTATFEPRE